MVKSAYNRSSHDLQGLQRAGFFLYVSRLLEKIIVANLTIKGAGVCKELGIKIGVTVHGIKVVLAKDVANVLDFKGDYSEMWGTIPNPLQLVTTKDNELISRYSLWQYINSIRFAERIDVLMDDKVRKERIARLNEVYSLLGKCLFPDIDANSPWSGFILNLWVESREDYFPAVDLTLADIHYGPKGFMYTGLPIDVPQEFDKANVYRPLHPWSFVPAKKILKQANIPKKLGIALTDMIGL